MPKKDAFTHAPEPLPPMTMCVGCQRGAEHEGELYALTDKGWMCRECFHKGPGRSWPRKAPGWLKAAARDKRTLNETPEQRADEAKLLAAMAKWLGPETTIRQTKPRFDVDGIVYFRQTETAAVEAKGRPGYTLAEINRMGGLFVEGRKLSYLKRLPNSFVVLYNLKGDDNAYVMSLAYVLEKGKPGTMDRTRAERGQDDKDEGLYVPVPVFEGENVFRWR